MDTNILFQTSIIAAFFAGIIALFAPCCVSYLLPAYLGSVFKERKRVLFMTFVYSLGIFIVMIPAVLGVKAISTFIFRYHDLAYLLGGAFMLLVGAAAFFGYRLPMINVKRRGREGTDIFSIFTLGIFSGITSACCAPVLIGVLTLSFLSPTLWQALFIGFIYVLGMVSPLYIASYFLDEKKVLEGNFFRRQVGEVRLGKKNLPIIMSNLLSSIIFISMGALVVYLTLATDFSMTEMASGFSVGINKFTIWLNSFPGINIIFAILAVSLFLIFIKRSLRR